MKSRLFLVDSSPAVQRLVEQASEAEGFEVTVFRRAHNALEATKRQKPDLIVADYHLEDMAFSAFCERLTAKECLPDTPIIALFGSSDRLDERQMQTLGVKAMLKKPLQPDDLIEMVRSLRGTGARLAMPVKELTLTDNSAPPIVEPALVLMPDPQPNSLDPVLRLSELAAKPNGSPNDSSDGSTNTPHEPSGKPSEPMAETMRGVVAHLLQSLMEQTERTLSTRLPGLVTQEVKVQVEAVDGLLPTMIGERVSAMEPMMQESIKTTAGPLVQELIEKQLREAVESAVTRCLAETMKEHLSRMDQLVMDKAEESALRYARETAERIVREVAQDMVKGVFEQAMREMTTGLALTR